MPKGSDEYRDTELAILERNLGSTAPIYKSLETAVLTESLTELSEALAKTEPEFVQSVLAGLSPEQRAKALIDGTSLEKPEVRKQLYDGGDAAIKVSTDPLIVLMRTIEPRARALRGEYDDHVKVVEEKAGSQLARLRFIQGKWDCAPDATGTPRLSYGVVKGYIKNGRTVPDITTIRGAFQHQSEHHARPPYLLPRRWAESKSRLKLATPLDFISTADVIGGSSGSPVVNEAGELVGVIFDMNLEALSWRFAYQENTGRSIAVDSRGIEEALRHIYDADRLADELTGGTVPRNAHARSIHTKQRTAETSGFLQPH